MSTNTSLAAELRSSWIRQAQRSPFIFAGLAGALLIILLAIVIAGVSALTGHNTASVKHALLGV